MNVRFHTAMFDHENFHSAKVIGNQVHLYHTADEDVVKFKNAKDAEEGLIELDKIIFRAQNGTYVPEGLATKDKAEALVESAIAKLDSVLDKVSTKAKGAITDAVVSKAKNAAKGVSQAALETLGEMQARVQARVDATDIPTASEIVARLKTKVQDTKPTVDVLPPEVLLRKMGLAEGDVEDLMKMILGEPGEEVQESTPEPRVTRDIPVTRAGGRKSLLDDADVFGTNRSVEPSKVTPARADILIPQDQWDRAIGDFTEVELRATIKYEISIAAGTEKVREMFITQGMTEEELQEMLGDYLEIIMLAALDNPQESLRDLITQLLN